MDTQYERQFGVRDPKDYKLILEAMLEEAGDRMWSERINPNSVLHHLPLFDRANRLVCWYRVGTDELVGAFIFDVSEATWYSNEPLFDELLLVKTDKNAHGILRLAMQLIEDICDYHNVKYIRVGNALSQERTAKMFANGVKKCGYTPAYTNFYRTRGEKRNGK